MARRPPSVFCLLASVVAAALLLQTAEVAGGDWGGIPSTPSESECRPYIEKALKEFGSSDGQEETETLREVETLTPQDPGEQTQNNVESETEPTLEPSDSSTESEIETDADEKVKFEESEERHAGEKEAVSGEENEQEQTSDDQGSQEASQEEVTILYDEQTVTEDKLTTPEGDLSEKDAMREDVSEEREEIETGRSQEVQGGAEESTEDGTSEAEAIEEKLSQYADEDVQASSEDEKEPVTEGTEEENIAVHESEQISDEDQINKKESQPEEAVENSEETSEMSKMDTASQIEDSQKEQESEEEGTTPDEGSISGEEIVPSMTSEEDETSAEKGKESIEEMENVVNEVASDEVTKSESSEDKTGEEASEQMTTSDEASGEDSVLEVEALESDDETKSEEDASPDKAKFEEDVATEPEVTSEEVTLEESTAKEIKHEDEIIPEEGGDLDEEAETEEDKTQSEERIIPEDEESDVAVKTEEEEKHEEEVKHEEEEKSDEEETPKEHEKSEEEKAEEEEKFKEEEKSEEEEKAEEEKKSEEKKKHDEEKHEEKEKQEEEEKHEETEKNEEEKHEEKEKHEEFEQHEQKEQHKDVRLEEETENVEEPEIEPTPEEAPEEAMETEKKTEEEVTPEEEDLTMSTEIPEKLRSREHIAEILKLDEESVQIDNLLKKTVDVTLRELKRLYEAAIKPLEILYKYRDLSNRHFGDPEIFSKPLILFMGPWSGGKSTIINYLLNNEYKKTALRTGAEPSPAYFNIVMWGEREEVLDGTQLAADWTFSGLQKFGQGLLDRLKGHKLNNPLLEKVNIVEIPGILEIRKQVERLFPFNDACQWFIDRADIIFLVYDPSKLDVGPETEAILDQLKGREYQTRIILNKADQVKPEELMRVQGTLIWNISPLMSSTEPPVMYSTSLWSIPYQSGAPTRLLYAQEKAFLRDLKEAVDKRVENKIASARRFAVRVRNHAKMVDCYLTTYYNHKTFFGNKKKISDDIIEHPQNYHIYEGLSTLTNISRYDLPDPDVYRDFFRLNPVYDFQQLSATCTYFRGCPINRLDVAIAYDLPELVGKYKKAAEETIDATKNGGNS